jgi:hypothetical protein
MPGTKPTTPATPTYYIAALDASHDEGDSGTTAYTFKVTRPAGNGVATVDYAVTGAQSGDFVGGDWPSGTVTFAKGQTSQTITILVAGDTVFEADENFTVTLSHPSQGKIGTATATGTIVNDDVAPNIVRDDNVSQQPEPLFGTSGEVDYVRFGINWFFSVRYSYYYWFRIGYRSGAYCKCWYTGISSPNTWRGGSLFQRWSAGDTGSLRKRSCCRNSGGCNLLYTRFCNRFIRYSTPSKRRPFLDIGRYFSRYVRSSSMPALPLEGGSESAACACR